MSFEVYVFYVSGLTEALDSWFEVSISPSLSSMAVDVGYRSRACYKK